VSADIYLEDAEQAKAIARDVADAARKRLGESGLSSDQGGTVRWATGSPDAISEIAARNARYAGLSLIGQPAGSTREALLTKVFEGVLLESGRPLVMVPRAWSGGAFGKWITIAWTPCKEAARAVSDAMPFIEAAENVHIVMIDPQTGEAAHGEEPGAALAAALAHHRVNVTVDPLPSASQNTAERLLGHAVDTGADLIVMGGYGHWRLRESLFGGVTRDMIQASTVPLLLAH
jgi:nucleotide-binding universal stress UspA family protein